jgi:phytoene synthase
VIGDGMIDGGGGSALTGGSPTRAPVSGTGGPHDHHPADDHAHEDVDEDVDDPADGHAHGHAVSHAALAAGSKSFRLAGRLLPRQVSDDAAVCYAWCRRADDLVDDSPDPAAGVRRLHVELERIYSGVPIATGGESGGGTGDAVLAAFQELVERRCIPCAYPAALVAGFAMDAAGVRYRSWADLELYGYRVAGVVGLMMTHVLGVHDPRCLPAAARLGMAMQLTNICRDVLEDWQLGRLYLPAQLLGQPAQTGVRPPRPERGVHLDDRSRLPPAPLRPLMVAAVRQLLARAGRYYGAASVGFIDLPWRSSFAIRVAALVYAEIGQVLLRRGCDVFGGRAVVPGWRKLWLVGRAALAAVGELPRRGWLRFERWRRGSPGGAQIPNRELRFPDDVVLGE